MDEIINFLKAISDETRIKIIKLLFQQKLCVCELVEILKKNQPCISQHLTILKNAKLVKAKREGFWIVYSVDEKELRRNLKNFSNFIEKPIKNLDEMKKEYKKLLSLEERGLLCKKIKMRR
jgi:ArsR family transcriptional regulator